MQHFYEDRIVPFVDNFFVTLTVCLSYLVKKANFALLIFVVFTAVGETYFLWGQIKVKEYRFLWDGTIFL